MNNSDHEKEKIEIDTEKSNSFILPSGKVYEFYLCGEIEDASQYVEWFHHIRNANENDIVRIHINSPGGDLFTAIQFIHVLAECSPVIEMHVEGMCMSAATLIFLMGNEFVISPYSLFMFHNYTCGIIGKGNEIYSRAMNERVWSETIFTQIYKDFLTPDEVKNLVDDKDLWMTASEVIDRLNKKQKALIRRAKSKKCDVQ